MAAHPRTSAASRVRRGRCSGGLSQTQPPVVSSVAQSCCPASGRCTAARSPSKPVPATRGVVSGGWCVMRNRRPSARSECAGGPPRHQIAPPDSSGLTQGGVESPEEGVIGVASRLSLHSIQPTWFLEPWAPVAVSSCGRVAAINRELSNKELEPTRSTHFVVGPRGSIQCCAGAQAWSPSTSIHRRLGLI